MFGDDGVFPWSRHKWLKDKLNVLQWQSNVKKNTLQPVDLFKIDTNSQIFIWLQQEL